MEFIAWLEETGVALWVRESTWGFPLSLILHALAMGFLVGAGILLALRLLGAAPGIPPSRLAALFPLMWIAFALSLLSGVLLLLAYPAKALTNPVFYLKFLFIFVALVLAIVLKRGLAGMPDGEAGGIPARMKWLGAGLLLAWLGAIASGRLLAYTYSILTV